VLCKAWTDRGLVYSAKGRIFNNMLYVLYMHLTEGQAYSYQTNPSSRQRGCYIKTTTASVQLKNKISVRESQGAWRRDELVTLTLSGVSQWSESVSE
jgi:hypothetical protein